jgi:peptidoglycan/LPS O-acetylase OafA/YrhL
MSTMATMAALPETPPVVAAPAPAPARGFYRPELDGLRFFAFLAVFWSHAAPRNPAPWSKVAGPSGASWIIASVIAGGWGVDLFFALSSYLITELLLREREARGRIDVKAFWVRRVLRIWPLYFAFYLGVLFVVPRFLPDHLSGGYAIAFGTFTANWALAAWGMVPSVVGPLWSVSIEEQFYLVWPLVARTLGRARLAILAAALLPLALAVRAYITAQTGDAFGLTVWCNTFARLDPIALGALLAVWLRGRSPVIGAGAARALLLASVVVVVASTRAEPLLAARPLAGSAVYTLNAIACCAALAGALALGAESVLAHPWLVYLGRISYGLYVFHELALRAVGEVRGSASPLGHALTPIAGFALTLALSAASYRWLEQPFLKLKERFTVVRSAPAEQTRPG